MNNNFNPFSVPYNYLQLLFFIIVVFLTVFYYLLYSLITLDNKMQPWIDIVMDIPESIFATFSN